MAGLRTLSVLLTWSAALAISTTAHADAINLATGLDTPGHLQTTTDSLDNWWQVTGAANPRDPPNAFVLGAGSADSGFVTKGWVPNGPNSSWIAANPDDATGNGSMTFTRMFTVGDPSTAVIAYGSWTSDDAGTLLLNGHVLSSLDASTSPWQSMHAFTTSPADFVVGLNTLTMEVTGDFNIDGARLDGLLVAGEASGGPPPIGTPVPEPATWAMMLIGLVGLGGMMRSRRRGGVKQLI